MKRFTWAIFPILIVMLFNITAHATVESKVVFDSVLLKGLEYEHDFWRSNKESKAFLVTALLLEAGMNNNEVLNDYKDAMHFYFLEANKSSVGTCFFSGSRCHLIIFDELSKEISSTRLTGLSNTNILTSDRLDAVMEYMRNSANIRFYERVDKIDIVDMFDMFIEQFGKK